MPHTPPLLLMTLRFALWSRWPYLLRLVCCYLFLFLPCRKTSCSVSCLWFWKIQCVALRFENHPACLIPQCCTRMCITSIHQFVNLLFCFNCPTGMCWCNCSYSDQCCQIDCFGIKKNSVPMIFCNIRICSGGSFCDVSSDLENLWVDLSFVRSQICGVCYFLDSGMCWNMCRAAWI